MAGEDIIIVKTPTGPRKLHGIITEEDDTTLHLQQFGGAWEIPRKNLIRIERRSCKHSFKHYSLELEKWICDSCGFPIPDRKEDDL